MRVWASEWVRSSATDDGDFGNRPFVSARLRYPLGESREKLERTSEEIFRQNELNDTQLDYIQVVRRRLERALEQFYELIDGDNRQNAPLTSQPSRQR